MEMGRARNACLKVPCSQVGSRGEAGGEGATGVGRGGGACRAELEALGAAACMMWVIDSLEPVYCLPEGLPWKGSRQSARSTRLRGRAAQEHRPKHASWERPVRPPQTPVVGAIARPSPVSLGRWCPLPSPALPSRPPPSRSLGGQARKGQAAASAGQLAGCHDGCLGECGR